MNYRALSLVLSLFLASDAIAQSQNYDIRPEASQLTSTQLNRIFKGLTHEGAYNFDVKGRPGALYSEQHHADGRVTYTEQGNSIKGQWAITPGDTICYAYDSDNIGGGCFRVYQLGTCYYFYSSYFIAKEDELDQDYWTARSVKKGDRATCEDMIS